MGKREVLICDADQQFVERLASEFRYLGWTVCKTYNESEAAYQLLMWYNPAELPELAILNLQKASELFEFCSLLKDEGIPALTSVIVLLDELDEVARGAIEDFVQLGVIPIVKSDNPWLLIKAVMDQQGSSVGSQRLGDHDSVLRNHFDRSSRIKGRGSVSASLSRRSPSP